MQIIQKTKTCEERDNLEITYTYTVHLLTLPPPLLLYNIIKLFRWNISQPWVKQRFFTNYSLSSGPCYLCVTSHYYLIVNTNTYPTITLLIHPILRYLIQETLSANMATNNSTVVIILTCTLYWPFIIHLIAPLFSNLSRS